MVHFIGITGHKPRVLKKAVETGEFDTVLVPFNVVTRQTLEELLPTAKAYDVGVVIMKPFSAKTSIGAARKRCLPHYRHRRLCRWLGGAGTVQRPRRRG